MSPEGQLQEAEPQNSQVSRADVGVGLQAGAPARRIENFHAAPAAAEFPNQINEIIGACGDIAGRSVAGVISVRASCRQFQRRQSTWAASA